MINLDTLNYLYLSCCLYPFNICNFNDTFAGCVLIVMIIGDVIVITMISRLLIHTLIFFIHNDSRVIKEYVLILMLIVMYLIR